MQNTGFTLVIVRDREEKELYLPVFRRTESDFIIIEHGELSRVMCKFMNPGERPSLIIVSTRVYPGTDPCLVSDTRKLFPETDFLLIGRSTDPSPPLYPLIADKVGHMVVNPLCRSEHEAEMLGAELSLTLHRLRSRLPLVAGDYINPGTPIHEFMISSTRQKEELIAALEKSIEGESEGCEMLRRKGALLADEMLENALYGAPRNERSQPLYSKGEERKLSAREQVLFRFGFDGETLVLEVTDGWGSLSREIVLENLARNQEIHGEYGGVGGRGLFIIWRFLDTMHIHIEPGRRTVIGGHINLSTAGEFPEAKGFHITTC